MYSYCFIDKNKIFGNSRLNMHIARIAQSWQSGIIQILKEHTSEVWKSQKKTLYGLHCTLISPCHRTKSLEHIIIKLITGDW
jgi:hypothetical protein